MNIIGLTSEEALSRLKEDGKNEIRRTHKISPIKILFTQFVSPLTLILIVVAGLSWFIGFLPGQDSNYLDAVLILIIVLVSGISGFFQEYKAEKSIEALQELSTPNIQVIRDGEPQELPVTELVVGDIVLLEAGDIIPADLELIESFNMEVDESVLTGESDSIKKNSGDEAFMGTSVYIGSAKARVLKTGMKTKIGKIAYKLQEIKDGKTSFESEIAIFSKKIFIITGVMALVVFIGNFFKYDLYTSVLASISLAVAAIPEGLPAVVTLALAIGARTMYGNNALIRKLGVVESIGSIDVVCTDKTGTLTKNEMSVEFLYFSNKVINIETVDLVDKIKKEIKPLIMCGLVCNNTIAKGHPEGKRQFLGEQTEIGLVRGSEKIGFLLEDVNDDYARISENSFSSDRKMMSVVVQAKPKTKGILKMYAKGAPEVLLEKCSHIYINKKVKKLSKKEKVAIIEQNNSFALGSLRVLGFAYKEFNEGEKVGEDKLIWLGLQAMADPPHEEVKDVLAECKTARVRVIMITGDNPITAQAIAQKVGLESTGVLTGPELDKLSKRELAEKLTKGINIFARTDPFHKQQILQVLEKRFRVAMTGDGVNDALALKQANVGIAMGKKGTTVAKESSDMVLMDDNFSTIVVAIKEGRRIFNNIRKFINYLLVSNIAEVMVIFLSTIIFTLDKPILLPVQILWINLLTDGLPALALGVDPAGSNIMKEPPRQKEEPIINRKLAWLIGVIGTKKTIILLLTFFLVLPLGEISARSTLFTGFILYEFVRIASIRSQEKLGWLSNPWLFGSLLLSVFLQMIVLYSPLNIYFHVEGLGPFEWFILITGIVVGYFTAILATKIIDKKFSN
jgi:Ca2+-transporting ATPase